MSMIEEGFQFSVAHKILEQSLNGEKIYAVRLLDEPFDGIVFSYGAVSFSENEEEDKACIHFDYTLIRDNGKQYDKSEFENTIGVLLEDMIRFELQRNNLVFTGGTDEDRAEHPFELDSQ